MLGHLDAPLRRARLERLLELARESASEFRRGFLGRDVDVLWEEEVGGLWRGLTGNYIRVYASNDCDLSNNLLPTTLIRLDGEDVFGIVDVGAVINA
jgi:threonylcarbamoyladenosine tRNA methylthiotransferase MtaB